MITTINGDCNSIYVEGIDVPSTACPLCNNENTHVEIRCWDVRHKRKPFFTIRKALIRMGFRISAVYDERETFSVPKRKVRVCPHCTDEFGYGYAYDL